MDKQYLAVRERFFWKEPLMTNIATSDKTSFMSWKQGSLFSSGV